MLPRARGAGKNEAPAEGPIDRDFTRAR